MNDIATYKARRDGSYKGWGKKNAAKIRRRIGKAEIKNRRNI